MHLNCPNCHAAIEVIEEQSLAFVTCQSCGSHVRPSEEQTVSHTPVVVRRIDEYELVEYLGGGSFGEVWKARDTILNTFVAIKFPRGESFSRQAKELFLREARIMATLNHPNIVRVLRVIDRPELTAIVMEYIPGTTLSGWLENFPFETPRKAVEFWLMVVKAVRHAHEAGVIHRDIKAGNVLLNDRREPKMSDFGLAKQDSSEFTVGGDNAVLGNYAHMSPEQAAGKSSDADQRSDVYSLGSVLYQLLARRPPFIGGNRTLSDLKQNDDPLPPSRFNPSVSRDLDTICLQALQRDPNRRYQSAAALAEDLERYLANRPVSARRSPPWERFYRWTLRNRVQAISGAVTVLAIAGMIISLYVGSQEPPVVVESARVRMNTIPSGARVVFHPLDPVTGEPRPQTGTGYTDTSPCDLVLPAGDYLVVAVGPDGEAFHEVYRRVPGGATQPSVFLHKRWKPLADGAIELPEVTIPAATISQDMVKFADSPGFTVGSSTILTCPEFERSIPSFYLDRHEVSIGTLRKHTPNSHILAAYKRTGSEPPDDAPVARLSWDDAIQLAEILGKRLPDEYEYEYAATNRGAQRYPWGDDSSRMTKTQVGKVGEPDWDVLPAENPCQGLFSSVAEWTSSWAVPYPPYRNRWTLADNRFASERIVRGGIASLLGDSQVAQPIAVDEPRNRLSLPISTFNPQLGLRCARSLRPRMTAGDFGRERQRPPSPAGGR